jgi:hypothetical protein
LTMLLLQTAALLSLYMILNWLCKATLFGQP